MSVRHVLTEVFLWLGIALLLLAAVGIVTLGDAFDRLHLQASRRSARCASPSRS